MAHIAVEPQDALARALEQSAYSASPDVTRLLGIARSIPALPDPQIDATFAARLEARLLKESILQGTVAAPERRLHLAPVASPAPAHAPVPANVIVLARRRFVIRRSVAAVIAAAMLTAVPIAAAGSAIPGSPLYPIKRAIERLNLALSRGPVADGFLLLEHAGRRLNEVDQLVAIGRTELVAATLDAMDAALRRGTLLILRYARDTRTLERLARALRTTTARISSILAGAPPGVHPDLIESLASGQALAQEVDDVLSGASPVTAPRVPVPADPEVDGEVALPAVPDAVRPPKVDMGNTSPESPRRWSGDGDDQLDSNETDAPCVMRMYVGPGAQAAQSVCAVVSNQQGDDREQDAPSDGPVTRQVQKINPPAPPAEPEADVPDATPPGSDVPPARPPEKQELVAANQDEGADDDEPEASASSGRGHGNGSDSHNGRDKEKGTAKDKR